MRRNVDGVGRKCSFLRSATARSNLISGEMLNRSSVNLLYLIVWKSHGHVAVSGLLFEILNTSGQSLCPGRINLSRSELSAANYMMRWQTGGRNKRRDGRENGA